MQANTWRTIGLIPSTLGGLAIMSVVVGLLPWVLAIPLLGGWVALMVLAALGRGEMTLAEVALLTTRRPTPDESEVAHQILRSAGASPERDHVLVDQEHVMVHRWGRRTVVLPVALLDEQVASIPEAAALARSDLRAHPAPTGGPALTVLRAPWTIIDSLLLRPIGVTLLNTVPLLRLVWSVRWLWFFFSLIVAWNSKDITDALTVWAFIGMTYIRPVAEYMEARTHQRAVAAHDHGVMSAQPA